VFSTQDWTGVGLEGTGLGPLPRVLGFKLAQLTIEINIVLNNEKYIIIVY